MDDGFLIWPSHLDIDIFKTLLNNLHPGIEYTIEKGKVYEHYQELNMLDILVILRPNGKVETEIFYKETNTHCYTFTIAISNGISHTIWPSA